MGLKCSLLGHSFDETDVEREREERGSEVVTIVKEVERCSRCGEVRVLSENKEVTSIVEPDDVGLDEDSEPSGSSTALGNMAAGEDAGGSGFESGSDLDAFDSPDNPEEEDAEILEDSRPSHRQPGQWPDDDADWDPGQLTRAEGPGDTDDADPTPEADDPESRDADAPASDPEPSGGGGEFIDAEADPANADVDAGTESSESTEPAAGGGSIPDGAFACTECGFTTSADNTPLRAGDSCPECQFGYLESGE